MFSDRYSQSLSQTSFPKTLSREAAGARAGVTSSNDPSSTDPQEASSDVRRLQSRRQGLAYQGAFEAVVAILIAAGLGYWLDTRFDSSPVGLLVGTAIGFTSFVIRLLRLGRQLQELQDAVDAAAQQDLDRQP